MSLKRAIIITYEVLEPTKTNVKPFMSVLLKYDAKRITKYAWVIEKDRIEPKALFTELEKICKDGYRLFVSEYKDPFMIEPMEPNWDF